MIAYTVDPTGNYILDAQGHVVSGAENQNYYTATITPNQDNTNYGALWNQAWNEGYNSSKSTTNPYSGKSGNGYDIGQGFTLGQQQYLKDHPAVGNGTDLVVKTPVIQPTGTYSFKISDFPNYSGWDSTAAYNDWVAKGKPSPGGTGSNPNNDALSAIRNTFNNQYNNVYSALDQYAGLIPQYQQQREQSVNNLYGTQQNEINTAMQGSLGALDTSRQNVAANQAKSVRDLQENMRNMLQAGNIQLGIGGAGDSSAANMYAYALSKQAGRSSADISNQASSQYSQIDAQAQQIRAVADDNLAKLGTWKADNLKNVLNWAQEQMIQIQQQKITATGQKAAALAAAETSVIQNALTNLQNIDSQIASWKQGIQSWALSRLATLDDAKIKMSNSGKYNAADITAKELQGMNGTTSGMTSSTNMAGYNPWTAQKKGYEDFLKGY